MCWHGGCENPMGVAEENFRYDFRDDTKTIDGGYFGKGLYFTQFMSYGDQYSKYRQRAKKLKSGLPLILSWVIMGIHYSQISFLNLILNLGNPYPVIEHPSTLNPNSLLGKPCKAGYDSHYVLVKQKEPNSMVYLPCDPADVIPDYDEIVIFNPNQILPRYLIYYSTTNTETIPLRTILWVDKHFEGGNAKIISKIEKEKVRVFRLSSSAEVMGWLASCSRDSNLDIRVISNGYREGDGDESAGS